MTVGFHSPLPPARTGVADYAAALLQALRNSGRVEPGASCCDVALYHLGNNQLHREVYARALARPGVAVLHDAVLQHFFLGSLDRDAYVEEFAYNYGEWSRELAAEMWTGRARSAQDPRYFSYPMLRRIAEISSTVIVHNPAAAAIVKAHAPSARVREIPHLYCPPPLPPVAETERLRGSLGLGPRTFLFGVFGHLRESKRLARVLAAFTALRQPSSDTALLVAGDFVSPDLARALRDRLRAPGILRYGYTPEAQFWQLAAAVDACINLRCPAAGETSGIAIRLMGIGKPVIVTAGEEVSRFPDDACIRVDAGAAEDEMLLASMLFLAQSRAAAREIGRRAAEHIRSRHALGDVVRRYWSVLAEAAGHPL